MMRLPGSAPSFKHTAQTPSSSASESLRGGERGRLLPPQVAFASSKPDCEPDPAMQCAA